MGVEIKGSISELEDAKFPKVKYKLRSDGPLVIFYTAGRHVGHRNRTNALDRNATESSFSEETVLCDAEGIMEGLHHAVKSDSTSKNGRRDKRQLDILKNAVARLLPDLTHAQIEINGPRIDGRDQSGVLVHTPSGKTPFANLSLGYQTMFAWTVDLVWRPLQGFSRKR